jgi:hypothetical protein
VWQSVIADLQFENGQLIRLELTPLVLNEGQEGPQFLETRGYPALAKGKDAQVILGALAEKSRKYGTFIQVEKGSGRVVLR